MMTLEDTVKNNMFIQNMLAFAYWHQLHHTCFLKVFLCHYYNGKMTGNEGEKDATNRGHSISWSASKLGIVDLTKI